MPTRAKLSTAEILTTESEQLNEAGPDQMAKDNSCLGGYAYQIIDQQAKRIAKLRSQVIEDTDIEPLHQMRVSTRRLRSALALFEDVIEIKGKGKKSLTPKLTKAVKKLTQTLGNVRDLDVMQQWFEQALLEHSKSEHSGNKAQRKGSSKEESSKEETDKKEEKDNSIRYFSKSEIETIHTLIKRLKQRRKIRFADLKAFLKGDTYKTLLKQLKKWVKEPAFTAVAQQSACHGAAQKIVAPIASLLEHPAWAVAAQRQGQQIVPLANITLKQLDQQLNKQAELIHDLRKQTKQVRYQAEFFRGLYGITYAAQIREFRDIQEILGKLQDQAVISEFLSHELDTNWSKQLPTIEAAFQASRLDLWQQWQPYQKKYLKLRSKLPQAKQAA